VEKLFIKETNPPRGKDGLERRDGNRKRGGTFRKSRTHHKKKGKVLSGAREEGKLNNPARQERGRGEKPQGTGAGKWTAAVTGREVKFVSTEKKNKKKEAAEKLGFHRGGP